MLTDNHMESHSKNFIFDYQRNTHGKSSMQELGPPLVRIFLIDLLLVGVIAFSYLSSLILG